MTGYTVHTGSNDKFRDGWDRIFKTPASKKSGGVKAPKAAAPKQTGKAPAKKKKT
ncbi:MAG TPA: hypothetical protein VNQ76_08975 [Planctomicrobium sp.]|nr:hypothetical protein [Planctomicrobium sp.]